MLEGRRADVSKAFLPAYEKGTKGITVFRYGSKKGTLSGFSATNREVRCLLREVTPC